MGRMGKERKSAAAPTAAVLAIVLVMVLPVLYILSIGPVGWLVHRGYLNGAPDSPLERFYRPMGQAMIKYPSATQPLWWYTSLWVPDQQEAPQP